MSLDTWKAEFYPVPADSVPESDTLSHSLRKWEGLRKENLEKHGLQADVGGFHIDSSTCALCQHYLKSGWCYPCPISTMGGYSVNCDDEYRIWVFEKDPEPMITRIKNAISKEQQP